LEIRNQYYYLCSIQLVLYYMKNKKELSEQLLEAWEETHKKGQLTLWIFLALRSGPKYVSEIKSFIETNTAQTIICEEQSLYRALRKFQVIEMAGFNPGKGDGGPDRKYYFITPMGEDILDRFIERNIRLFFKPEIESLMTRKQQNQTKS
jgi:PadR family transcriptional regulator, regulatory protein PadR